MFLLGLCGKIHIDKDYMETEENITSNHVE